jgi:hypothetical protein
MESFKERAARLCKEMTREELEVGFMEATIQLLELEAKLECARETLT